MKPEFRCRKLKCALTAQTFSFAVDIGVLLAEVWLVSPLVLMNLTEQPAEVQSPAQRAGIIAALACLGCMVSLFSIGRPVVEWFRVWWAELLIYTLLPIALTFAILLGSCIHREMRKVARALFLLLFSLLIWGGVCLALGAIAFIALANLPLSRFHY